MKANPAYTLHYIADVPYLLPHGQGIAEHKRGIRLNHTGVFLWNALQEVSSRQELLERAAAYYEAAPEDMPLLKQDLAAFLNQLSALGILTENPVPEKSCTMYLKIGPVLLRLIGPADAFSPAFQPFQISKADNDAQAALTIELKTAACGMYITGSPLIQHQELCVYETAGQYQLQFPQALQLHGAELEKDGSYACIYHTPPYTEPFATDLFHAVRVLFLYTAQRCGCYALHSASILYREKAWLFSGPSGMGKSTHTNLWKELYHTPVLNGDLNLLSLTDGSPVIYGIPWCGTSGIADTAAYPLGGIILLNRGEFDECQALLPDKKILLTAQRLISPAWTCAMLQCSLDFMAALAPHIQICLLKCTKNPSAAQTAKRWIDAKNQTAHTKAFRL